MVKKPKRSRRLTPFLLAVLIVLLGFLCWVYFFTPTLQPQIDWGWRTLTRESRRLLRWEKEEISPEEKQIREEVILKKMEEANASQDWRSFAPEYPRPQTIDPTASDEEKMKALKNSPEFKEMEKALIEYLKEKEGLFSIDPPTPSLREATNLPRRKDKGTERVIESLLSKKERPPQAKPLEENLQLGMKGPLATRRIVERPPLPQVSVRVETEIELTFWVLPNGIVDRAIPSMKGDTELEQIAIQYLKQWRFAPLPKDGPQEEEWGVIPIKFKFQ
jgi:TonB family protein